MSERILKRETLIPVVLLLFALGARIYQINQGFWYDELYTILNYIHAPLSKMLTSMPRPNNHVLSNLLARLSIGIFGESEFSVRLPSLILGSITVPALYVLGRRVFPGRVALVASLLFCFSKWPVWFAQEARGYAGMILCGLVSQMLFLELIQEFRQGRAWLYFFFSLAAIYFHPYSAFIIASHALVFLGFRLWREPGAGWKPFYAALAVAVAALILYAPMFSSMMKFLETGARVSSGRDLSGAFIIQWSEDWGAGRGHPYLSLIMAGLFLIGLIQGFFKRPIASAAFIIPVILILLVTSFMELFIYHRFLAFFLPFYFLIIACGIEALSKWIKLKRLAFAIMAVLLLALVLRPLAEYYRLGMQGFRPAARWIQTHHPSEQVYSIGLSAEEFRYYLPSAIPVTMGKDIEPDKASGSLVVASHPWSWGNLNTRYLSRKCKLLKTWHSAGYDENNVSVFQCEH